MNWRNTSQCYGWVFAGLHWLMAVLIVGLLALGLWMVGLDYYHPWYVKAPDWHRSLGIVVGLLLVIRLLWRWFNPPPRPRGPRLQQRLATGVHWLFYGVIAATVVAGFLISTAKGQAISVFGFFEIPSPFSGSWLTPVTNLEDLAGVWHRWLAYALAALIVLHVTAAVWHHVVNRDGSMQRILAQCDDS
jgi:cytochrome b561